MCHREDTSCRLCLGFSTTEGDRDRPTAYSGKHSVLLSGVPLDAHHLSLRGLSQGSSMGTYYFDVQIGFSLLSDKFAIQSSSATSTMRYAQEAFAPAPPLLLFSGDQAGTPLPVSALTQSRAMLAAYFFPHAFGILQCDIYHRRRYFTESKQKQKQKEHFTVKQWSRNLRKFNFS